MRWMRAQQVQQRAGKRVQRAAAGQLEAGRARPLACRAQPAPPPLRPLLWPCVRPCPHQPSAPSTRLPLPSAPSTVVNVRRSPAASSSGAATSPLRTWRSGGRRELRAQTRAGRLPQASKHAGGSRCGSAQVTARRMHACKHCMRARCRARRRPHLRAFGVQQDGQAAAAAGVVLFHQVHHLCVALVAAVAHVEPHCGRAGRQAGGGRLA